MLEKVMLSIAGTSVVFAVGTVIAGQMIRKKVDEDIRQIYKDQDDSANRYMQMVDGLRVHQERIKEQDAKDSARIRSTLEELAQQDPYYAQFIPVWS